jgi:hypothetical protein
MKHASSLQLFEYWNAQRGSRVAPERGDIDPGPIRGVLSDTFILGRDGQGYRFRLAGTRACALFCRELKAADFLSLWPSTEQVQMQELLAAAADQATGFVAGVTARIASGASAELELLVLPLRNRDRTQTRLIGVLAPLVSPYWLGTKPVETMALGTIRHLGPGFRHVGAPRLVPGAEAHARNGFLVYDGGRS